MKKDLSLIRHLQKKAMEAGDLAARKASDTLIGARKHLEILDRRFDITANARTSGNVIAAMAQQVDKRYDVSGHASKAKDAVVTLGAYAGNKTKKFADESGLNAAACNARDSFHVHVVDPAAALIRKHQLDELAIRVGKSVEHGYGSARSTIKPYFLPETATELLLSTKRELAHISACIMQISAGEAEKVAGQFGAAIASKMTGIAATGALLTVVSTFGTAGTGTAIASLSGAASANATMAWVGSLLGGGMATGAVLTGGLGIVVGLGAYRLLSSERRAFENLDSIEQRIVQTCWLLIALIDEMLESKNHTLNRNAANDLLNNTLLPLQATLTQHAEDICANLDGKNSVAFRQHVLVDFERVVVDGFRHQINSFGTTSVSRELDAADYAVGGVIYALLTRTAVDESVESQLVLASLRRSDKQLEHASEAELSEYLDGYDPEQLKGIANNVKGIYHEQLWVHQYNKTHDGTYAELFGATNNAGADVQIKVTSSNDVVSELQLKATDSTSYVREHLSKYPDIDVRVTNETAERISGVEASGIENAEITDKVNEDVLAIAENTLVDRAQEAAEISTVFAGGSGVIEMLRGNSSFPQSVTDTVKKAGAATAATAVTAFLFS